MIRSALRQNLYEEKGESVIIYGLAVALIVLAFIGIDSCARRGFRNQMEGMSRDFVSRQQADESAARRMQEKRRRALGTGYINTQGLENSPIKAAVSEDTARMIKKHSLAATTNPSKTLETNEKQQ
ncbi:MAG: hypothetical protein Q8O22_04030 [Candidatus Omnitrophota bacterium]|nr:hypothetical protein [Candidatus Omnitrophota bacterium]